MMNIQAIKKSIILFPGQGSQYVGMVKDLTPRGKSLYEIANQVLGYNLLKLCQNGPESELNRTVHSQPAVFVANLAAVEKLAEKSPGAVESCVATAGFSLGEFSSLVFAQSIDFVDALKLIKLRAEITQVLSDSVPSGMMTVIYGNNAKIEQACKLANEYCVRTGINRDEATCSIANYLFPHGKVIGGHQKALDFIQQNGKDFGLRSCKRLPVSGAFHTAIMKPAARDLAKALAKITIKKPMISVYSNVDAQVYRDPDQIRRSLAKHVYKPVLWEQLLHKLYDNCRTKNELASSELTQPKTPQSTTTSTTTLVPEQLSLELNCNSSSTSTNTDTKNYNNNNNSNNINDDNNNNITNTTTNTYNENDNEQERHGDVVENNNEQKVSVQYPVTFECGPQNNMITLLGMVNKKARQLAYNIEP